MFYALSWFVVFTLFLLWSLAAWAFHSLAVWTVANAGTLAPGAGAVGALQMPVWLAPWVPPELALTLNATISALMPTIDAVLGWAPAMAGGLSIAVWTVWGIGSALLVVLGLLATGLIALLRSRVSAPVTASRNLAAAR